MNTQSPLGNFGASLIELPQSILSIGCRFELYDENDNLINAASNRVVNEGLDDLLNVYFRQTTQRTNFYLALFTNNIAPAAGLTAGTFNGTQAEFVNYDEATRPAWVADGAPTAQTLVNNNALGEFTFGTGGGTVRGGALLTNNVKGGTSGVLVEL